MTVNPLRYSVDLVLGQMISTGDKQTSTRPEDLMVQRTHPQQMLRLLYSILLVARDIDHSSVIRELTFDTPDSLSLPRAPRVNLCGMCLAREGSWRNDPSP